MRSVMIAVVLCVGIGLCGCTVGVVGTPEPRPADLVEPSTRVSAPVPELTSGYTTGDPFVTAGGKFEMTVPRGWNFIADTDGTSVSFRVPVTENQPSRPSIAALLRPLTLEQSLRSTVDGQRGADRNRTDFRRATVDEPVVLRDGVLGHLLGAEYDAGAAGGGTRTLALYAVTVENSLRVMATAPVELWDVHDADFESALRSVILRTRPA